MKKKFLLGLLVLVLLMAAACSNQADDVDLEEGNQSLETSEAQSQLEELPKHDKYVLEIDGRGVSKEDYKKNVLFQRYSYIAQYGEEIFEGEGAAALEEDIKYQVQEELARELVYVILAEKNGFEMNLEEAKAIYEDEFLVMNTPETLEYFEENGLDADFVINRIAIDQQVGTFIENIQDEYLESEEFNEGLDDLEMVRASHILVETEEEAKEVAELLEEEPSRFGMLASERSTCSSAENEGDLGYFEFGDMVPEFSKAAFDLEVDEISDIVESDFGYHVILLTDKGKLADLRAEDSMDPSLEKKVLNLSFQAVGEKIGALLSEQLEATPITYYNLED